MSVNVNEITATALKLKPATVLGLVLVAPFFLLGWLLRLAWLAPAYVIAAGIKGWQQADAAYDRWRGKPRP